MCPFASRACIVAVGGFRAYTNRCGAETVAADHLGMLDPFPWFFLSSHLALSRNYLLFVAGSLASGLLLGWLFAASACHAGRENTAGTIAGQGRFWRWQIFSIRQRVYACFCKACGKKFGVETAPRG